MLGQTRRCFGVSETVRQTCFTKAVEHEKAGVIMSTTIWEVRMPKRTEQENAQDPTYFRVEESTALLRAIFPNYPDISGMKPFPEVGAFLRTLRTID
jgi:hypothetical protein